MNGALIGSIPQHVNLIETTFKTWKLAFPESDIMNANTGFSRRYSIYPYGDYGENQERLLFPINMTDTRIPMKERVLGVLIETKAKAYRFNTDEAGIEVLYDSWQEEEIVIIRSKKDNFIVVFHNPNLLKFEPLNDEWPAIVKDELDNYYNLAGRILQGPCTGEILTQPTAFMGYWFSWPAFYPDIELFDG